MISVNWEKNNLFFFPWQWLLPFVSIQHFTCCHCIVSHRWYFYITWQKMHGTCTCGKQQMKRLIIRKSTNRERSGLAVWRVQVRSSNQTGMDDLYLLLWQYTFWCISSEQSNGSYNHMALALLWGLHQVLVICVLKRQLDHFYPWTVAGWFFLAWSGACHCW